MLSEKEKQLNILIEVAHELSSGKKFPELFQSVINIVCTSALASIAAMLTGVVMLIMWTPLIIAWAGCGVAALVIVRHWRNIADLLRGRERSFSR